MENEREKERNKKATEDAWKKVETLDDFLFFKREEMTLRPPDINQLMAAGPTAVTAMENLGLLMGRAKEREREKSTIISTGCVFVVSFSLTGLLLSASQF